MAFHALQTMPNKYLVREIENLKISPRFLKIERSLFSICLAVIQENSCSQMYSEVQGWNGVGATEVGDKRKVEGDQRTDFGKSKCKGWDRNKVHMYVCVLEESFLSVKGTNKLNVDKGKARKIYQ